MAESCGMAEWPGAKPVQFPSTAENSVSDTSIAVICDLVISSRRPSSWHRSESSARAADAVLNRATTIEHRKTIWRYKAVSPWSRLLHCSMSGHQGGTAASLCQDKDTAFRRIEWTPHLAVSE